MKILIAYASVSGTAAECAVLLEKQLPGQDVTLYDIQAGHSPAPDPADFDAVVVGGSVRFGKFSKKMRKYLADNAAVLSRGKTVYFVCCAFCDRVDEYFEDMLTSEQHRRAVALFNFGGELKPHKQKNIFAKIAVRIIKNDITEHGESDDESASRIVPEINTGEIGKAADALRGC